MKYRAIIIMLFGILNQAFAQNNAGISLSIEKDFSFDQKKIISSIVKITNRSGENLNGFISLELPKGLRSISGDTLLVEVPRGGSAFVPIRLMETGFAAAGRTSMTLRLMDKNKKLLRQQSSTLTIPENNTLKLVMETPAIFITNARDSVKIKAVVSNTGNKNQYVTLVFGLLNHEGQRYFVEQKKVIPLKTEASFELSFLPSVYILDQQSSVINIAVMRGSQKDLIDNAVVTVQNVLSSRRFTAPQDFSYGSQFYSQQSITAIFRQIGDFANAFQIIGSGNINLPVGNLAIRGNLYKSNTQQEVVATNTALSYQVDNHELTVGNINEVLEYSLFGRGASLSLATDEHKRSLKVGFVDANFNLLSPLPLLFNGYSAYAIATHGNRNTGRIFRTNIVYRDSPMENARHTMVGGETQLYINNNWNINFQLHGGLSNYLTERSSKPSMSSALQYSGKLKNYRLNGNYYFSTDYFPGNRRGNTQINQMVHKELSKGASIWANVFYMNLSPKYIYYTRDILTQNVISSAGYTFPKFGTMNLSVGYQNQFEKSNAYTVTVTDLPETADLSAKAHRGTLFLNWHSPNYKNILSFQNETGVVRYTPNSNSSELQLKLITAYTYKWFNLNASFQSGSYFLSEYVSSLTYGKPFKRLAANATINKNFVDNKLITNIGTGYSWDYIMGNTPSALANIKYLANRRFNFYTNVSWYQYRFFSLPGRDLFSLESGVTYNLKENSASTAVKSKVSVFLYLDKNANNIYDKGDIPASGYFVNIGTASFVSNNEGRFTYSLVPFNTYKIHPIQENGWFYEGGNLIVSKLATRYEIPLKQMGSVSGNIFYDYDEQRSLGFEVKAGGIAFIVSKNNQVINRIGTDESGKILQFLPTGHYQIELDINTLPENTYCNSTSQSFDIESGKITNLLPFEIKVKNKKINIKRFGDS